MLWPGAAGQNTGGLRRLQGHGGGFGAPAVLRCAAHPLGITTALTSANIGRQHRSPACPAGQDGGGGGPPREPPEGRWWKRLSAEPTVTRSGKGVQGWRSQPRNARSRGGHSGPHTWGGGGTGARGGTTRKRTGPRAAGAEPEWGRSQRAIKRRRSDWRDGCRPRGSEARRFTAYRLERLCSVEKQSPGLELSPRPGRFSWSVYYSVIKVTDRAYHRDLVHHVVSSEAVPRQLF